MPDIVTCRSRPVLGRLGMLVSGWCVAAGAHSAAYAAPRVPTAPEGAASASAAEPLTYEADKGQADLTHKRYVLKGRVCVVQGPLSIAAHEAWVQQRADGSALVSLTGGLGGETELARFEQRKVLTQEVLLGQAMRVEYDNKHQVLVMKGQAVLRRYQRGAVVDEVQGEVITYRQATDAFEVEGGQGPSAGASGRGRVKGTLSSGGPGEP